MFMRNANDTTIVSRMSIKIQYKQESCNMIRITEYLIKEYTYGKIKTQATLHIYF